MSVLCMSNCIMRSKLQLISFNVITFFYRFACVGSASFMSDVRTVNLMCSEVFQIFYLRGFLVSATNTMHRFGQFCFTDFHQSWSEHVNLGDLESLRIEILKIFRSGVAFFQTNIFWDSISAGTVNLWSQ